MSLNVKLAIDYQNDRVKLWDMYGVDGIYVGPTNIEGIFKLTGPNGIIYKNTGWDTQSFASPDVDGSTADWDSGYIDVPVDSDGNIVEGTYKVEYLVTEGIPGNGDLTDSKEYVFSYTPPTPVISILVDLAASTMKVTDSTAYSIATGYGTAEQQEDLDNERTWFVRYPVGAGTVSETAHTENFYVGPNLWSGNYDVQITSNISYLFDIGTDGFLDVEIIDIIIGKKDDIFVNKADCILSVLECLTALAAAYELAKNTNLDERDKLSDLITEISWYYNMYSMAVLTGTSTTYYCNILATLLVTCGCSVSDSQAATEEILAVTNTSGSGAGDVAFYLYKYYGTVGGKTVFTLPITLTANTPVFVNGTLATATTDYTGIGTKTLTFVAPKYDYDYIVVMSTEAV